ncbi:hypothetical protein CYMTET_45854 [Cymbomonas tetramitiformis]|uniref:Uncharacterized protein n=1 Tax=Cymbomonas tetramitiformis TaxID=36881 RepID=A0AAE0BYJ6_9CHLO|nr:hypothetical protein CYMTET_45854 [Cymbomonas tetramitiformis]
MMHLLTRHLGWGHDFVSAWHDSALKGSVTAGHDRDLQCPLRWQGGDPLWPLYPVPILTSWPISLAAAEPWSSGTAAHKVYFVVDGLVKQTQRLEPAAPALEKETGKKEAKKPEKKKPEAEATPKQVPSQGLEIALLTLAAGSLVGVEEFLDTLLSPDKPPRVAYRHSYVATSKAMVLEVEMGAIVKVLHPTPLSRMIRRTWGCHLECPLATRWDSSFSEHVPTPAWRSRLPDRPAYFLQSLEEHPFPDLDLTETGDQGSAARSTREEDIAELKSVLVRQSAMDLCVPMTATCIPEMFACDSVTIDAHETFLKAGARVSMLYYVKSGYVDIVRLQSTQDDGNTLADAPYEDKKQSGEFVCDNMLTYLDMAACSLPSPMSFVARSKVVLIPVPVAAVRHMLSSYCDKFAEVLAAKGRHRGCVASTGVNQPMPPHATSQQQQQRQRQDGRPQSWRRIRPLDAVLAVCTMGWLTCAHAVQILQSPCFVSHQQRLEVIVSMFGRLVDKPSHFWRVMRVLSPVEQMMLQHRLGVSSLCNVLEHPQIAYHLDPGRIEDAKVLGKLLKVCKAVKSARWDWLCIEGSPVSIDTAQKKLEEAIKKKCCVEGSFLVDEGELLAYRIQMANATFRRYAHLFRQLVRSHNSAKR